MSVPTYAVARLQHVTGSVDDCTRLTWPEVVAMLGTHIVGAKGGNAWMPCLIEPGPRRADRVEHISLLTLDIEAKCETLPGDLKRTTGPLPPDVPEVADRLRALGWCAALATSYSHEAPAAGGGTLGPRYRVVLPTSRPLQPTELRPLGLAVADALGLSECVDTGALEAARLYFLPRHPLERAHLVQAVAVQGQPIVVDMMLAFAAPARIDAPHTAKAAPEWTALAEAEQARVLHDLQSALTHIPADDRGVWVQVAHHLASLGEAGKALFTTWSATSTKYQLGDEDVFDTCEPTRSDWRAVFTLAERHGWVNPGRRDPNSAGFAVDFIAPPKPETLAVLAPFLSEDGLALEFAKHAQPHLRWSPGLGWMRADGGCWVRDDDLKRFDAARLFCRESALLSPQESERRRITSAKGVSAVLTLAQSDRRIVVPADAWDRDPLVLNTPSGLIDLCKGEAISATGHLLTQRTACAPDFKAAAPLFERFLQEVFLGDADLAEFVQRALGYCLTGDRREQVLFFAFGAGANGKSTLLDLVEWVAGTYALKLPAAALMTTRNEQHPTGVAALRAKRLALSSELEEGAFFNEALLKQLTGDSTLSARYMRGDFFSFDMTQKHVVIGNHKPRLRGGDPAMQRRIRLIPFDANFPAATRDPHLLGKLKAEGPAVLAWLIRGAAEWHAGGLGLPDRVRGASADYMTAHDDLQMWIDDCCDRAGESAASDLYANFRAWKERRGEHAPTQTTWGERLQRVPGIEKRRSNGMRYFPIRVKPPAWGGA